MNTPLRAVVAWLTFGGLSLASGIARADDYSKTESGRPSATSDQVLQPSDKALDPKIKELPALPDRAAGDDPVPPIFAATSSRRFYAGADYLMWWVKDASLPIPLVTTLTGPGENGTDKAVIGLSGTSVIYGNGSQALPTMSGLRVGLGMWLDDDQTFGIEGSAFSLSRRSAGFYAASDATGNPNFAIPVNNSVPFNGGSLDRTIAENAFPIGQPNDVVGVLNIQNSLRLWGAEVNGVAALVQGPTWQLYGVAGFRYLDLFETFSLEANLVGIGMYAGSSGQVSDYFQTRNQFYGGTLGFRGHYQVGAFSLDATGKVAMGASHEVVNIRGAYTDQGYPQAPAGNQGIFAQPANSGNFVGNDFAVVPEANLKIAYELRPWWRVTVGYDFLYYSSVVRPGDQLSHSLPKGQIFGQGGSTVSTTSPAAQFNTTDFYAHGVSFGMAFRY